MLSVLGESHLSCNSRSWWSFRSWFPFHGGFFTSVYTAEYATYRKEKQPIEYPSAGSTFKRGNDFITAKLIDECGLKGYQIGGAQVSEKHAGFIINKGNATAEDVKKLMKYVEEQVYNKFGKKIEPEIEII